ncbi:DEBR0S3_06766g1_1 [Brettanomyces bruxellensis]|uniref:DEBR0S3_06766g1_1 n=1 Tax=Dekkera bruxellensis TaxID=5007 RepID=A0A7D9H1K6_DEKBR|nr:DEBR0S3_06766g1_1 [Brettanomyces bruxellensis]
MSQSSIQETSFEIKVSGPSLIKRRGNARVASDHVDALAEISQLSDFERSFCATIDNAKSAGNFQKEESDSNKSRNESLMPLNQPYDNALLDIPYSSITKSEAERHQVWSVLYIVLIQGILTISRFQNVGKTTFQSLPWTLLKQSLSLPMIMMILFKY